MQLIEELNVLTSEHNHALHGDENKTTTQDSFTGKNRKLYIESYGCQMNFADSEIVAAVMMENGYDTTSDFKQADVVFLNTCSIRDNAEQRIRARLKQINAIKREKPDMTVGVLGCMAERLKSKLLDEEKMVDIVAGPDSYRDIANLVGEAEDGNRAINVYLSREETYADITPIRLNSNGVNAFITIMRGCDNMCSFCVVPFTRGRERSRDAHSIVKEAQDLFDKGYREVMLLGQNVDSYKWENDSKTEKVNFAQLLEMVALVNPDLRIRFSTSHPKDITDEVIYTIKKYENICNYIHLPVQSGSSRILDLMNRTYTKEWYMNRIDSIRNILGADCGISTDIITGFCSETEEDHQETLSMMKYANYDYAYMFSYSERPNTPAAKKLVDNIPEVIKKRRHSEIMDLQNKISIERNQTDLNKIHKVLIEGYSKRSNDYFQGKTTHNKVVVFPKENYQKGQYVNVLVHECSKATLLGKILA
ncbi:MAG: tRNA (N6-isopentenyl adenosine(37)-C2)-methylthiotransferase MiaB [Cytophagales bacterium]|nr:MAG: tRNA (N6-isopentenyl adenosine(37)-C2)-methylthiotransferase MiaB [Cytophagales bacterium]